MLTIESVDATHAGLYNCTASNTAGVASHTTELIVKGAITTAHINVILLSNSLHFLTLRSGFIFLNILS